MQSSYLFKILLSVLGLGLLTTVTVRRNVAASSYLKQS